MAVCCAAIISRPVANCQPKPGLAYVSGQTGLAVQAVWFWARHSLRAGCSSGQEAVRAADRGKLFPAADRPPPPGPATDAADERVHRISETTGPGGIATDGPCLFAGSKNRETGLVNRAVLVKSCARMPAHDLRPRPRTDALISQNFIRRPDVVPNQQREMGQHAGEFFPAVFASGAGGIFGRQWLQVIES